MTAPVDVGQRNGPSEAIGEWLHQQNSYRVPVNVAGHLDAPPWPDFLPSQSSVQQHGQDGMFVVPTLPKELGLVQQAFEHVQTELLYQSRRQEEVMHCVTRLETDLSTVAKLTAENEGLHAAERHQRHSAISNLTRVSEDAVLTGESLRKSQECLLHKVEHLEAMAKDGERVAEDVQVVQREVALWQGTVQEKLDILGHAMRRLESVEQVFDENLKLRQEVAQLRRANERRDIEMAAVQGQIDALTKLVREQFKEPPSPTSASRGTTASQHG